MEKISTKEIVKQLEGKYWQPVDVVQVNESIIRIAKFKGEYHWHKHQNEDELFYVLEGKIIIEREGLSEIILEKGELVVIPKGLQHRPKAESEALVMLIEPITTRSKGD
ncbi:MAG: cupin domain-containing protein [Asgard group archaeon]|nr:cupin domain-containing protein [Asgard group archaeon]